MRNKFYFSESLWLFSDNCSRCFLIFFDKTMQAAIPAIKIIAATPQIAHPHRMSASLFQLPHQRKL
jgi:hypothetical protein